MSPDPADRGEVAEEDLAMTLLDFDRKNFSFDRLLETGGARFALFARTETESESRFRPRVLRLRVVVPRRHLALDPSGERLVATADPGRTLATAPGEAVEAAAEPSRFEERGIVWLRQALTDGGYLYVPESDAPTLLLPPVLDDLGLSLASGADRSSSRNRGSA